jgi:hypothetical protein
MCSKHKILIWNKMIDNPEFTLTLLQRPHPQSAGTIKSQRRVGTHKHPPKKNHNQQL